MLDWKRMAGGIVSCCVVAAYWSYVKKQERLVEKLAKQNHEIDDYIKKSCQHMADLANNRPTATVVLDDGTEMDFGEYLDTKIDQMLKDESDLQHYLED